jgi:hypothetical protein
VKNCHGGCYLERHLVGTNLLTCKTSCLHALSINISRRKPRVFSNENEWLWYDYKSLRGVVNNLICQACWRKGSWSEFTADISALRWWKSLLEYVTRWHKTSLNGFGMITRICEGWSTFWFVKHNGEGESGVVSSWCITGRPSGNCYNKDPSSSMWLDNTKPSWISSVSLLASTRGSQWSCSWSILEERSPEWIPHSACSRPSVHRVDKDPYSNM